MGHEPPPDSIFHIAPREAWEESVRKGRYVAGSLASEGFIHCSTRSQVLDTANRYYRAQSGLVLMCIDPGCLTSRLEYEPPAAVAGRAPRDGLFPHVYGPIDVHAFSRVVDFDPNASGEFGWPEGVDSASRSNVRSPADNLVEKDERVQGYWETFRARSGVPEATPYQGWYFGDAAELARELADLVVRGQKRAATTLLWAVEHHPPLAPVVGSYSVVTEVDSTPRAVIRTSFVDVRKFDAVDAQFASEEGEGDRTLETWRSDHAEYFSRECALLGRTFDGNAPVVLERFELVFGDD